MTEQISLHCEKDSPISSGRVKNGVAKCLGSHGLNVVGVKNKRPQEITITSGKTTINFIYGSRQNLKKDLFERIVARLDAFGYTDLKQATVEKSDYYYHELIFSDMIAEQNMVLVHFQLIDISIGYFSQELSYTEVADMATRLNDVNNAIVLQGEKEMVQANENQKFDISAQENFRLMVDFIEVFQKEMECDLLAGGAASRNSASGFMDRNTFAEIIASHYSIETEGWNSQKRAQNLSGKIVKSEDSETALFYRHYSLVGTKACIGYALGTLGHKIYKNYCANGDSPDPISCVENMNLDGKIPETTGSDTWTELEQSIEPVQPPQVTTSDILAVMGTWKAQYKAGRQAEVQLNQIAEMDQLHADAKEYRRLADEAETRANEIADKLKLSDEICLGDCSANLQNLVNVGLAAEDALLTVQMEAEVPSD